MPFFKDTIIEKIITPGRVEPETIASAPNTGIMAEQRQERVVEYVT